MGHSTAGAPKRIICPSCKASVVLHTYRNDFMACPRCGDWLDLPGRDARKSSRVDYEPKTDFDEGDEWERNLTERIG